MLNFCLKSRRCHCLQDSSSGLSAPFVLHHAWGLSMVLYRDGDIAVPLLACKFPKDRDCVLLVFVSLVFSLSLGFLSVGARKILIKTRNGASLVAQWLRVRLPTQGTRVRAPVREDPTCRGAAGPVSHGR